MITIWLFENCRWPRSRKHWCCNVQFTSEIVHSTYRHQMFAKLIKKHNTIINRAVFNWNVCIHDEKGLVISFHLEIFFANAERFHVGLGQKISISNHMSQCSTCFMEDRCSFMGFVVAYGGFKWFYWLQTMLNFNVLDLCFPWPISGKWQNLDFFFISTIIADI